MLLERHITDIKASQYCTDPIPYCTTCFSFVQSSFVSAPNYLHACPQVEATCVVPNTGLKLHRTQSLECLTLGAACPVTAPASTADPTAVPVTCDTCVKANGCGWCSATEKCMPRGSQGPYCR